MNFFLEYISIIENLSHINLYSVYRLSNLHRSSAFDFILTSLLSLTKFVKMASAKFFTIVFAVFFMGAMIEQSSAQWYYYPVEYEVPVYEYVAPYYYYGKRSSGFSPDDQQPQKRSYNPKFKKF